MVGDYTDWYMAVVKTQRSSVFFKEMWVFKQPEENLQLQDKLHIVSV